MKNILIIIAILTTITVQGQQLEIGFNTGLSYTKVSEEPLAWGGALLTKVNDSWIDYKRLSAATEFYVRRQHKNWFYQVGIQNIQFGYHEHDAISTEINENNEIVSYWRGVMKFNFSYLHLPLRLGYRINCRRLKILPSIGVSPGLLLAQNVVMVDHPNPDLREGKPEGVEKFNFNVLAGLGLMYELNEKFDLQMNFTRQIGLKNMSNEMYYPNSYFFHRGSFLTLGLNYKINKKSKSEEHES
jgi:hypothetical protein